MILKRLDSSLSISMASVAVSPGKDLPPDRQELVDHFVSVTGATEDIALQFLESHDWQLESGVHAYMAIVDDGEPEATNSRNPGDDRASVGERWEEHYMEDEEDAPELDDSAASDSAKEKDRTESSATRGRVRREGSGREEGSSRDATARTAFSTMQGEMDGLLFERFRNFAAEGYAVPASAAAPVDDGLESMFPPPKDLMFLGNFDALRKRAEDEKKYCLVNIQRRDEFPSHELNRDTWKVSATSN